MKKFIFLLSLFFSFIAGAYAQVNNAKVLTDSYQKGFLTERKDTAYYQNQFFNALPSNFKSFKSLYGWNEDGTRRALSSIQPYYFFRFFATRSINEDAMIKKMTDIAINATWAPGAINDFQQGSFQYALSHNKSFIKHLKTLNKKDIVAVWTFYFDYENPMFRKASYDKMIKEVQKNDKAMIPQVTEGYTKSGKKWAVKYKGYLKAN